MPATGGAAPAVSCQCGMNSQETTQANERLASRRRIGPPQLRERVRLSPVQGGETRTDQAGPHLSVHKFKSHAGCPAQGQRRPARAHGIAVFIRVPRLWGLGGSRYAKIGFVAAGVAAGLTARLDANQHIGGKVESLHAPVEKDQPRVGLILED